MKDKTTINNTALFKEHKTYTPQEVLAAGGATAFGRKSGKDMHALIRNLQKAPVAEPFTNDEWEQTLLQLKEGDK